MELPLSSDVVQAQRVLEKDVREDLPKLRMNRPRGVRVPVDHYPSTRASIDGAVWKVSVGAPVDDLLCKLGTRPEAISEEEKAFIRDLMLRTVKDVYWREVAQGVSSAPYRPGVAEGLAFGLFVSLSMWLAAGWTVLTFLI